MPDREILLGCDCAGMCSVMAGGDWTWENEPDDLFFQFYEAVPPGRGGLRWRLGQAWAGLTGRERHHQGLCFTDPAKVEALRDFLTECLDARKAPASSSERAGSES